MADDLTELERLFHAVVDLPPDERRRHLAAHCPDADLRRRVLDLLDHDTADDLPSPARGAPDDEGPGSTIGRYRLLEEIGEGGFGVVYRAQQLEPVVRDVALKVIKLGMDTREVVARFEAERQALALMDHPHIAKVLDGGVTASGRPYFVMELVRGVAITDYCARHGVDLRGRLELFERVCGAVQHAHQKGVVHRDIKPSNVLVTLADGEASPRVIDFGVAKAMHSPLTGHTLFTHHGQLIGTPAYMSPEQADPTALDVDTRTDVYSLGVLLYELLTGELPFDTRSTMREGLAAVQRMIREERPSLPSARAARSGHAAEARALRGDLDWIVMKALEKDRARRYPTAAALAGDVARHLAHEPVEAGRPSAWYRLRKLVARNRSAAAALFAVVVTLAAGVVGVYDAKLDADASARRADARAEEALSTLDFLVSTLSLADPAVALAPDPSVRTLLDRTALRVDETFADRPLAELRVRSAIGRAYRSLSENELAETHLRRAVELIDELGVDAVRDAGFGGDEVYATWWALTNVAFYLERPDAFGISRAAREHGLAHVARRHPELGERLTRFTSAVERNAWSPEPDALDEALALFDTARAEADVALAPRDPLWPIVADTFLAGGYMLWYTPHEPKAERYWRATAELQAEHLPPGHPDTATTVSLLASLLNAGGRADEIEPLLRETLASIRRLHADDELPVARARALLGENLAAQGRFDEAEPMLLESHATILDSVGDPANFQCTESFLRLADLYEAAGREDDARAARDALAATSARSPFAAQWAIARHALPPGALRDALDDVDRMCGGTALSSLPGRAVASELDLRLGEALAAADHLPADDLDRQLTLARLLVGWARALSPDDHAAARARMAEAALARLALAPDAAPVDVAGAHAIASDAARRRDDDAAAREHAEHAWRGVEARDVAPSWHDAAALVRVARVAVAEGLAARVAPHLDALLDVLTTQLGDEHDDTREAHRVAAAMCRRLGRDADAERHASRAAPAP